MWQINRRHALAGVAAVAATAGWGIATRAQAQAAEVLLGIPADTSNNLPLMLASALGFFGEEGINARVVQGGGGGNVRQMVAAGQLAYSMGDVAHPLAITGAGKKAKALLAIDTRATVANMMVRKELWDAGVRTPEALGNLRKPDGSKPTIGVTRIGSATWLYGNFIMTEIGLVDKVNFVSVGDGSPMLGAFRTGKVDAIMANIVTYLAVLDDDMGKPAFDSTDKAAWDKYFGSDIPSQCLFALDDQIKAQPIVTQGVVNSIYRALKHIERSAPKDLFAAIEGKFMTGFKPEVAIREIEFMKPIFDFNGNISEQMYKNGGKIWFSEGTKIAPQPYVEMVDLSFLRSAQAKFG